MERGGNGGGFHGYRRPPQTQSNSGNLLFIKMHFILFYFVYLFENCIQGLICLISFSFVHLYVNFYEKCKYILIFAYIELILLIQLHLYQIILKIFFIFIKIQEKNVRDHPIKSLPVDLGVFFFSLYVCFISLFIKQAFKVQLYHLVFFLFFIAFNCLSIFFGHGQKKTSKGYDNGVYGIAKDNMNTSGVHADCMLCGPT